MSDISIWSNSAGGNTTASPNGFPEGMPPSGVNDAARELMAAVRRQHESAEWIDFGWTPTYVSASSFTLAGDRTGDFHANRRLRCSDGSSTLYGTIASSTYTASTGVFISLDSGSLTASLSAAAVGILKFNNDSLPRNIYLESSATATVANLTVQGALSVSGTASFTSKAVFNGGILTNGTDISGTASFAQPVIAKAGFLSSATASFTSRAVFNSGIDVSATASLANVVKIGGTLTVSGTASFAASVLASATFGSPTGGNKGAGTANGTIYDQGKRVYSSTSVTESSEITLTASSVHLYAHGLTGTPNSWRAYIRCKTTEYGYASGDEVALGTEADGGVGTTVFANATNLGAACAGLPVVVNRSSPSSLSAITAGNWKLFFRLWTSGGTTP